jgi:hemoglobin
MRLIVSVYDERVSESNLAEEDIYQRIGEEAFSRMVAAFYRQVAEDDILGPMYPRHDLAGAEERLRDFLKFRFGGPMDYLEKRGHPRLRMRHAPFRVDEQARDRWVQMMDRAIEEAAIPEEAAKPLRDFFHSTATFLRNA